MALASMAGSALGNTVSRAAVETDSRAGGSGSRDTKESPANDKDSKTSDKLNLSWRICPRSRSRATLAH